LDREEREAVLKLEDHLKEILTSKSFWIGGFLFVLFALAIILMAASAVTKKDPHLSQELGEETGKKLIGFFDSTKIKRAPRVTLPGRLKDGRTITYSYLNYGISGEDEWLIGICFKKVAVYHYTHNFDSLAFRKDFDLCLGPRYHASGIIAIPPLEEDPEEK
jgi:hypothetical protein